MGAPLPSVTPCLRRTSVFSSGVSVRGRGWVPPWAFALSVPCGGATWALSPAACSLASGCCEWYSGGRELGFYILVPPCGVTAHDRIPAPVRAPVHAPPGWGCTLRSPPSTFLELPGLRATGLLPARPLRDLEITTPLTPLTQRRNEPLPWPLESVCWRGIRRWWPRQGAVSQRLSLIGR